jgi:hypothetical protein
VLIIGRSGGEGGGRRGHLNNQVEGIRRQERERERSFIDKQEVGD